MGYTAKVDRELCVGAGACVETAPKAFGFDDEHIAVVLPEAELRASFADGWRIDSLEPTTIEITLDPAGAQAWLAAMTRT